MPPPAVDLWAGLANTEQSRLTGCDVCRVTWQALSLVCSVLAIPKQKRPRLITEGGVAGL